MWGALNVRVAGLMVKKTMFSTSQIVLQQHVPEFLHLGPLWKECSRVWVERISLCVENAYVVLECARSVDNTLKDGELRDPV
jgi:hypothetical protein